MDGSTKYAVRLAAAARRRLEAVARNGSAPAKKVWHARVLLMSDQDHDAGRYHDSQTAAALGLHVNTVARVRKRFVLEGEAPALDRRPRLTPPTPPKLDGHAEAALVATCCSAPPAGRARWTPELLRGETVGRGVVASVCRETVRTHLKKAASSPGGSGGSASRNRTRRGSSPRWSRCSTSTPGRPTPTSR